MSEPVRILIVEDVPSDFDLAQREIRKAVNDCVFQQAQTREDFLHALDAFQPDLILSDYHLPSFDGLTALKLAQEHAKLTPFIIWTGTLGEDVAVECMKAGAVNYILKDNIKRLGPAVAHALEERRLLLEHEQAAEIIQNNEKRFRALIENGLDNISLLAEDGTLMWESPATVRTLGYEQDEFLGQNIFQLMHPDDITWTGERLASLIQKPGGREQGIFRLRHQDGTWRWTEAVVTNLLHEPSVGAIVINYRDITERKQAEERLNEERNLLRTLIDHLPDRIYVMDAEGHKTLSNAADWKASGVKKMEDVIGKTDFDTYPREMAQEFWALDKAVLDSGEPVINYEEPGLDAAGNLVWVLSTKVPLRDSEDKVIGLVGIGRDITERKQAEIERQTLLEIMQGLADTDDLQHFLRLIHRSIARMIYAENFFVVLYREDTGLFEEIYSVDQYDEPAPPSALEKSVTSYVFRTGEPLLLTQPLFDQLAAQGEVELVGTDSASWLGAPLKTQHRTIGVIAVQDYENPDSYTERDKDFLALIGSQVALAIERKQAEEALRENEAHLQSIINNGPECVKILDFNGHLLEMNPAGLAMIEADSLTQVFGQDVAGLVVPEHRDAFRDLTRSVSQGSSGNLTFEVVGLKGTHRWLETHAVPLRDHSGSVKAILGMTLDITEQKRSADQQKYHARLLRHINDAVIATDDQFRITAWNRAAEKMYGWSSEEVMGRNASEVLSSYLNDEQRAENRELLKQSNVSREERIYQRRDGKTIYVEANTIALTDEQSKFTGYVSVNRDITERKKVEVALRQSEEQYRSLFEDSPISLWVEDFSKVKQRLDQLKRNGIEDIPTYVREHPEFVVECANHVRILDVNSAAMKLYHASQKSELLGSLINILSTFTIEQFEQELIQLANNRFNFEREEIDHTLTGEEIHVNMRWSVAPGYEDSLEKVIISTVDITERKRAEEKLRLSDQILQRVKALVLVADSQGSIVYASPAAKTILGFEPEELLGDNWWKVSRVEPGQAQREKEYLAGAARGEIPIVSEAYERSIQDRSGSTRWISWVDAAGPGNSLIGVGHDITERKRAEERAQLQIQRLKALRAIDVAISSSFNLSLTFDFLLDQVITQLKTDAAAILLFQPITRTLTYAASRGFRSTAIREARIRLGEGYVGQAFLERRMIHIPNLMETDSGPTQALLLKGEDFIDYYGLPLLVKGEVKGVLEIFHRSALADDPEWLDFLETLAGQAVIAIENTTLFENLQQSHSELFRAYDATIEGWSHALDLRDKETEGHTQRVAEMTMELAHKFGFTDEQLSYVRWGALLHDIGKMGVPDNILLKPDKLTEAEWETMKKHPTFAFEMLSPIRYLKSSLDIPYCHHEKWDGTGYPRGLKGEVIPLAARLFAVVDVWDALRSDRPYRRGWSVEKTVEYIRSQAGSHFDPKVVEPFLEIVERRKD